MLSTEHAVGWVYEVFVSIQGEGLFCGQRQTFVRLAGCNLDCAYCDTPAARDPRPAVCQISRAVGGLGAYHEPNPLEARRVAAISRDLGTTTVAVTGGEPLAQPAFTADVLRCLKSEGHRTYLETNGSLPDALAQVRPDVDIVAMDIKIKSAGGAEVDRSTHLDFLRIAAQSEVFVKIVVGRRTTPDEVAACAELIAQVKRSIPLVIQPVTGVEAVSGALLMELQEAALKHLDDVRVIPQCHRILGLQ